MAPFRKWFGFVKGLGKGIFGFLFEAIVCLLIFVGNHYEEGCRKGFFGFVCRRFCLHCESFKPTGNLYSRIEIIQQNFGQPSAVRKLRTGIGYETHMSSLLGQNHF